MNKWIESYSCEYFQVSPRKKKRGWGQRIEIKIRTKNKITTSQRVFKYICNINREENNSKELPNMIMSFQNKQCHQVPCKMNKTEYKAQYHEFLEHLNKNKNLKIEEIKCF